MDTDSKIDFKSNPDSRLLNRGMAANRLGIHSYKFKRASIYMDSVGCYPIYSKIDGELVLLGHAELVDMTHFKEQKE